MVNNELYDLQKLVEYDMHYQAISNKFIYASRVLSSMLETALKLKAVLDDQGAVNKLWKLLQFEII